MSDQQHYRPPVQHFVPGGAGGSGGGGSINNSNAVGGGATMTTFHNKRRGGQITAPPKGYIPGLGRGAAGFTTRSDLGPMGSAGAGPGGGSSDVPGVGAGGEEGGGTGSRSAELRLAKIRMKQQQQQQARSAAPSPFGVAPAGYVPGMGRGAGIGGGGSSNRGGPGVEGGGEVGGGGEGDGTGGSSALLTPSESYNQFSGYDEQRSLFDDAPYEPDDEEADAIYASIDKQQEERRKNAKLKKKRQQAEAIGGTTVENDDDNNDDNDDETNNPSMMKEISNQFRDLKKELSKVSEEEWLAIPDATDSSLRRKNKRLRQEQFATTVTSDILLADRLKANRDATSGGDMTKIAGTTSVLDANDGAATTTATLQSMVGLSTARGTVLNMSLDKYGMAGSSAGTASTAGGVDGTTTTIGGTTTSIDPRGYLTSLSSVKIATDAEIGDIHKARLLLKSVRDTNPNHGPGWIASARVEEAANNLSMARKLIQQACLECPQNEDVWLEAARLHMGNAGITTATAAGDGTTSSSSSSSDKSNQHAKTILATAVRRMLPKTSVKIFLKAADLEQTTLGKKAVLRKALEAIPSSVTLWKAAIDLEDDVEDAKILLGVAVEKVPTSVDLWLALARLETYDNARKVLNQARKNLPMERRIWISAAKLEESQQQSYSIISKIIQKAVQSLMVKHEAAISRDQWLSEAEAAEQSGAPLTSKAIVEHTIGWNVEDLDRPRTWSDDAARCLSKGSVETARSILAFALKQFPTKKKLWWQAVELERSQQQHQQQQQQAQQQQQNQKKDGSLISKEEEDRLDEVLEAACQRLPHEELFWLVRAKEQWSTRHNIDKARDILREAFKQNKQSEDIWLAASKLEWESNELDRARILLERARVPQMGAPTPRVYMKSALLERQTCHFHRALELIDEALTKYPKYAKLYMMGGQICSDDMISLNNGTTGNDVKDAIISSEKSVGDRSTSDTNKTKNQGSSHDDKNNTVTSMEVDNDNDNDEEEKKHDNNDQEQIKTISNDEYIKWRDRARDYYRRGMKRCPTNVTLWILASHLEERIARHEATDGSSNQASSSYFTKARGILELARLSNPKHPKLWVEAIRMERRAGNDVQGNMLLSKALQECPDSGLVLAESILMSSKPERKSKSAIAIHRAPDDPFVILAVARLFSLERKQHPKARKWFERAISLDPDLGDAWAYYYAFEVLNGTTSTSSSSQAHQSIKERCIKASPAHGELWCSITKQMKHRHKSIDEKLELVSQFIMNSLKQTKNPLLINGS